MFYFRFFGQLFEETSCLILCESPSQKWIIRGRILQQNCICVILSLPGPLISLHESCAINTRRIWCMDGKYRPLLTKSRFADQDVAADPPHAAEVIQPPRRRAADRSASTLNQILIHILYWRTLGLGNWPPHHPSQQKSQWVKGSSQRRRSTEHEEAGSDGKRVWISTF